MRHCYKLLSIVVCFCLLLSICPPFEMNVSASDTVLYETTFDSNDGQAVQTEGFNEMKISGGELSLERTDSSNVNFPDKVNLYAKADKTAVSEGKIAISFSVKRSAAKGMSFAFCDAQGKLISELNFQTNSAVTAYLRNDEDTHPASRIVYNNSSVGEYMNVKAQINQPLKTISIYIGDMNTAVCSGYYAENAGDFSYVTLEVKAQNYHKVSLDNYKINCISQSDEETIVMDYTWLTHGVISKEPYHAVTNDLYLPKTGEYGSKISWSSSDTKIVTDEGKVIRPADNDASILLTATIQKEKSTLVKELPIVVLKQNSEGLPIAENGYITYDEMDSGKMSAQFTVASGNPVISSEGVKLSEGDSFSYFLSKDFKSFSELIAVSLDIRGEGAVIDIYDDVDTECFSIRLQDNKLSVFARSLDAMQNIGEAAWTDVKEGLIDKPVTIVMDPITDVFTLWYGNDIVANSRLGSEDCSKLLKLNYTQVKGSSLVGGVSVYLPKLPSDSAIELDKAILGLERLTWQTADHISEDLSLPKKGKAGSTITWSSDKESVITSSGEVKLNGNEELVTLTAAFKHGEKSKKKVYSLRVPAILASEKPDIKKIVHEDKFENNTTKTMMENLIADGTFYYKNERFVMSNPLAPTEDVTRMHLYLNNKSMCKGIYGVEFTMKRSGPLAVSMSIMNSADYFRATWHPDGSIDVHCDDKLPTEDNVSGSSAKIKDASGNAALYTGIVKMRILFNTSLSTYSLWVNDDLVLKNKYARFRNHGNIQYLKLWMDRSSVAQPEKTVFELGNFKVYESYPLSEDRVGMDYDWLTDKQILDETDSATLMGYVSKNLILPDLGSFGSNIKWSSSDTSVITHDGKVNVAESERTAVMTAKIYSRDASIEKKFTIKVAPNVADDAKAVDRDLEYLTEKILSPNDDPTDGIKRPLSLPAKGVFNTDISWESDTPGTITQTGRVIRPRVDEPDKVVKITATVRRGEVQKTKTFTFKVLSDIEFVDPDYMSDEEFFGVYDKAANKWTVEGKLDYSYKGLDKVEAAVKAADGDYTKAQDELAYYFSKVRKNKSTLTESSRFTGWANMITDNFQHLQRKAYYKGDMVVGREWKSYSAQINPVYLNEAGAKYVFSVRAWYNEDSYAEIARSDDPDTSKRPRLELVVNGAKKIYMATDDAMVRSGIFADNNYKDEQYLTVSNYGDFIGDDLQNAYIMFDLSDLTTDDVISSANLILYARSGPEYVSEKRLILLYDPDTGWTRDSLTYNTTTGYIFSFNGLGDLGEADSGYNGYKRFGYKDIEGANIEYHVQNMRFYSWPVIAAEYQVTGNEDYAYKAQQITEDFITETGNWLQKTDDCIYDATGIRGAYPGTLSASQRMMSWMDAFPVLIQSKYANGEFVTAWLKNIWDTGNYLNTREYCSVSRNGAQSELQGLMDIVLTIPEFTASTKAENNWYDTCISQLEEMLFLNTLDDGSYVESTDSYGNGATQGFVDFKKSMMAGGANVSKEYDKRLLDNVYYQVLLYANDGTSPQYGDSGLGTRPDSYYIPVAEWYGDEELKYILTYGAKGKEPQWTSRVFTDSTVATLRGSWSKESPWLFTTARGGGAHGHRDYNSVLVHAYGRSLLVDSGYFIYDGNDPYNIYGKSTRAHNTVLVNDINQRDLFEDANPKKTSGITHDFETNKAFDQLAQSTPNNEGVNHRRTITYVKPNIFFISDWMEAENKASSNNYKQIWHMHPEAKISVSDKDKIIRSNYTEGANVILAFADSENVDVKTEQGWVARSYAKNEDAPYAYFEKRGGGTTYLDTVIIPNKDDPTAKVLAERLETRAEATALRTDFALNGKEYSGYFYLSYDGKGGNFGNYTTDAQTAYVQFDKGGNLTGILIKEGSYIKEKDSGKVLAQISKKTDALYVDLSGTDTYITSSAESVTALKVQYNKSAGKVYVNEQAHTYSLNDGYLHNIGTGTLDGSENKESTDIKEVISGSAGGGGAAGGSSGGKEDKPETPVVGGKETSFVDTEGHWANEYILDLKAKNIVNGDENGKFNPNNKIKRSEFVAIVTRALGLGSPDYNSSFMDVSKDSWYANSVQAALDKGIISKDTFFRPNDPITRQEMAKIIAEAKKLSEKYTLSDEEISKYSDKDAISPWAKNYVALISKSGLMTGRDDGGFYPTANATRAEAATVISRMIK